MSLRLYAVRKCWSPLQRAAPGTAMGAGLWCPGVTSKQWLYFTTCYRWRISRRVARGMMASCQPKLRSRAALLGVGAACKGVLAPLKLRPRPSPAHGCRRGGCTGGSRRWLFCVLAALVTTSPAPRPAKQSESGEWALMRRLRTLHPPSLGQPT